MNNQPDRLTHFDGLRGIAAFTVFLCHFLVAFYPGTHTGAMEDAHTSINIETWLRNSPFNLLFNGKFSVCVFFAISGFVLSYPYFQSWDKRKVAAAAVKRYPRLMILVWLSAITTFMLLRLPVFDTAKASAITHSSWLGELFKAPVTFREMIVNIGYEQFVIENVPIPLNPVLWTIATELKGSFLVFIVLLLRPSGQWRYPVYAAFLVYFNQTHYALFIFGLMLADINCTWKPTLRLPVWIWVLMLITILVFGSYKPETPYVLWSWIGPAITFTNPLFIGAAALLFLTCYHPAVQSFLNKKPNQWLGRISYPLYICHLIVICAIVCPVFSFLYRLTAQYHVAAMASLLFAIPVTLGVSLYFFEPADQWSIRVSNKLGRYVKARLSPRKELKEELVVSD